MLQALPLQPLAQSEFMHQVDSALFQYAGADSFFDVLAGMQFEDDGFNPQALQQQRQKKTRGAGSDNSNLGAHVPLRERYATSLCVSIAAMVGANDGSKIILVTRS